MENIMYIFPQRIKEGILLSTINLKKPIEEIRIVRDRPIIVKTSDSEHLIKDTMDRVIYTSKEDVDHIVCLASEHSMYLKEDEINKGYMTLKGGCRIGICGTVSYMKNSIAHHGNITSLNIRLQREIIGCSKKIVQSLIYNEGIYSTLIVSPPKKGKTTLLRDMARVLSDEKKFRVGIVDERKEIWGMGDFNVGMRSDVLCGCNKQDGIMMLIRTMAPDVIIVDELGGKEDAKAVEEAINCGVAVIASIHGSCIDDVNKKGLGKVFDCTVILGNEYGDFKIFKGGEEI